MLLEILIIFTATILIWSLPPESKAEALARLDFVSLIDHHRDQSSSKELVWLQIGQPDLSQWEAQGRDGTIYKVWFEHGVGWRVQKINDGFTALEITARSEREAKGVAVLDHG